MATLVAGKLDEISRAIGALEASTTGLHESFDKHCLDDDRRHGENLTALNALSDKVGKLTEAIQASRWWRTGAVGVLMGLVGFIGWLVPPFVTALVNKVWK